MTEVSPIVSLNQVSKSFPGPRRGERIPAVENVTLTVSDADAGEFVALLGPSGCGKSTILNLISGLLTPDSGEVKIFGQFLRGDNSRSATVPQAYTCFPWLSVRGNIEFGLALQGKSGEERRKTAGEYLEKVGLSDRADAYPRQLSGGMQQRVAIARTLATRPAIVLMDEPFGALDAQTRAEMQQMLLTLWESEKNLILFVTHDINEALLLADRIIVFSPRPARIVHDTLVPFARPRRASLTMEPAFLQMAQALLQLLKPPVNPNP